MMSQLVGRGWGVMLGTGVDVRGGLIYHISYIQTAMDLDFLK